MLLLPLYFNSIKVRLELADILSPIIGALGFQFHKGAIRTKYIGSVLSLIKNFNSIKVRLEQNGT